jgi:hypothetical protein
MASHWLPECFELVSYDNSMAASLRIHQQAKIKTINKHMLNFFTKISFKNT